MEQLLGLVQPPPPAIQGGEVGQGARGLGVVGAEVFLAGRQRVPGQRLGLGHLVGAAEHRREVGFSLGRLGMIRSEDPETNLQRLAEDPLGLMPLAIPPQRQAQRAHRPERLGVLAAEDELADREHLTRQVLGLSEVRRSQGFMELRLEEGRLEDRFVVVPENPSATSRSRSGPVHALATPARRTSAATRASVGLSPSRSAALTPMSAQIGTSTFRPAVANTRRTGRMMASWSLGRDSA